MPTTTFGTGSDRSREITRSGRSSKSSSYSGYAAGISALSGVFSDEMATQQFKAQLEAETNAAIQNAGNLVTSFELQQAQNRETINNINHILGDKLSERGLNAMKEASLLRAAAAETGTSGGTTDFAIKEAFINENMDKANLISAARQQQKSIFSAMNVSKLNVEHGIDSLLLGGGVNVGTNVALAGVAGGLTVAMNTLNLVPMSERVSAFGINTNGDN